MLYTVAGNGNEVDVDACDPGAAARAAAAPLELDAGDVLEVYRGRLLVALFRAARVNPSPAERRRLERQIRKLEAVDCSHVARCRTTIDTTRGPRRIPCPKTFRTKGVAIAAVLDLNPALMEFLQAEWTHTDQDFVAWLRGGRVGRKPRLAAHDGRFDLMNEGWELHGARAISCWSEAVYRTIPSSRHWLDMSPRLALLAEAAQLPIHPPDEETRLLAEADDYTRCLDDVDRRLRELVSAIEADDAPPF